MQKILKTKEENLGEVEITISNLLFRTNLKTGNLRSARVFNFMENYGDIKGGSKFIRYRPAYLVKGKKWHVAYQYKVPDGLPAAGTWKRFKVYQDINRNRDLNYAKELLKAVNTALDSGWSPFVEDLEDLSPAPIKWTINQAMLFFITKWKERGLAEASIVKYERSVKQLIAWLTKYSLQNLPATELTRHMMEKFLLEAKKENEWSARTYNNTMDYLDTACGFLVKEKIIVDNPTEGIYQPKTASKKHRYYDQKTLDRLVKAMKEKDPYLYFAFQCVYHLCVRSEKELKNLKVGNIFTDRMQVLLTAGETKTNADRFIPMSDEILRIFEERSILSYPSEHYVFGVPHKNKWIPDGVPGTEPFGNGFFSKRFAKIREALKLSSDYTLYGAKHTRVIHLKKDGAKDDEIMSLTGHKDFTSYSQYLRDLGVDANVEKLSQITRKI